MEQFGFDRSLLFVDYFDSITPFFINIKIYTKNKLKQNK